jgi:protein-S-isoprenylcysteine O-methyltransferase Ste14
MDRVLVAVILAAFVLHRGLATRQRAGHATAIATPERRRWMSWVTAALALGALAATAAFLLGYPIMAALTAPVPGWLRWVGVGVALAGFVLLEWSQRTLGPSWSDSPRLLAGQALVSSGPYRWVRHPIYAAFLLILGSILPVSGNVALGGLWLAMTAIDIAERMAIEEALMLERFGDEYQRYIRRTGRLLPRF